MESGVPEVNQRTHWDGTYARKADFFGVEPSEFGVRAAATLAQHGLRKILELGCGQGRDTFLFLQRGFEVTGLDYAEAGLRQMQERAAALGVEKALALQLCDVRKGLPFPDQSFDGCFSHMFFTMELREKELQGIFGEVLRVLKPGGLNIYSVRNVHDPHFQKGNHIAEDMWQNPMGAATRRAMCSGREGTVRLHGNDANRRATSPSSRGKPSAQFPASPSADDEVTRTATPGPSQGVTAWSFHHIGAERTDGGFSEERNHERSSWRWRIPELPLPRRRG